MVTEPTALANIRGHRVHALTMAASGAMLAPGGAAIRLKGSHTNRGWTVPRKPRSGLILGKLLSDNSARPRARGRIPARLLWPGVPCLGWRNLAERRSFVMCQPNAGNAPGFTDGAGAFRRLLAGLFAPIVHQAQIEIRRKCLLETEARSQAIQRRRIELQRSHYGPYSD